MINYHKHEWHDRDEVLKKVFPENHWQKVKYYVCRCAEIRTDIIHLLDPRKSRKRGGQSGDTSQ